MLCLGAPSLGTPCCGSSGVRGLNGVNTCYVRTNYIVYYLQLPDTYNTLDIIYLIKILKY